MNWKDLKDFCNSLPESELEKEVIVWQDCSAINCVEVEQLTEDYYYNPDDVDNGCFPESEISDFDDKDELKIAYVKGTPIIMENI